jgi:hypothetical protein
MPVVGQAQSTPVRSFTLKQVGANVWAAIDNPAAKGVVAANGGFVIGDDGVAVIDSFASATAPEGLLTQIRRRTKIAHQVRHNTTTTAIMLAGMAGSRTPAQASSPGATCARGFMPRTCVSSATRRLKASRR